MTLIYLLLTGAWIVLSDWALGLWSHDAEMLTRLQTYKGLAWTLLSAAVMFYLVRRELRVREREQLERRQSEAKFRHIFDSKMMGVAFWDAEGGISEANDAFLHMVGYTRADLNAGRVSWRDLTPEEWRPLDDRALEEVRATGVYTPFEKEYTRSDGTRVPVLVGGAALDGTTDRGVAFLLDNTEQRRLREQLLQSQKMEAVGRLAGGVAHDFNNLLTAILGNCEMLLSRVGENDPQRHDIDEIFKAGQRASALTQQLLAFSRRQVLQPTMVDLNEVVAEMVEMLSRLIGEQIEMSTALAPDLAPVRADRGQLGQAILNLVVNARDAMPAGGALRIETANVEVEAPRGTAVGGLPPGRWVRVSVRDSGEGMDPATLAHIFEPFFTTKPRGTGLGLATVSGIVEQSSGRILVDSRPGEGSAFHIFLPRIEAPVEAGAGALPRDREIETGETLLLLEDDEGVRGMLENALRQRGYRVLVAGDGENALRASREHLGPIHLLLADVVMPGLTGPETAALLRRERPELRVLFMSGHADDRGLLPGALAYGAGFIQKPFTPLALADKVRKTLDPQAQEAPVHLAT